MKPISSVLQPKDGEKIVGKDQHDIAIIDMAEVAPSSVKEDQKSSMASGKYWYKCPDCGNQSWHEVNGKTYYHKLACRFSNGIGYNDERIDGVTERLKARI